MGDAVPDADRDPDLAGRPLSRRLWGYGLRGWGGVFANLVNWRLDQAILPALTGPIQIGYYAVAVSLAEVPSMIIGAVKQVVFTETSSAGNLRLAARATRIVILLSLVSDLVLAAVSHVVVPLLFGSDFEPAVRMAQILLVANIPWTAEVVLATGLLSAGRPGLRSIGQIVAAVLTITGLALLVPRYGGIGAAWTSLVAYTVNFIVSLVFFHRESGLPLHESLIPRAADVRYLLTQARRLARRSGRRGGGADVPSTRDTAEPVPAVRGPTPAPAARTSAADGPASTPVPGRGRAAPRDAAGQPAARDRPRPDVRRPRPPGQAVDEPDRNARPSPIGRSEPGRHRLP